MFTFERLRASLSTQSGKKFLATAFVAIIALVGVLGSMHGVLADNTDPTAAANATAQAIANDPNTGACGTGITSILCEGVAFLLGLVADLIGRMILLVISVLIAFAQYNSFSSALPVEQGWIVVRDTTNMFFIIVLLLTAFATVIGRDEFHYSKILPRLLMMAVVINFSKTIIQIGIDFSQVVMLTFVNAFAQSGAGNFVYALGLDQMMQIGNGRGAPGAANIIIAYMLAIFFMSIALGVVIILTCFLIYRIVALWVVLIISPLAFFITALPPNLKSKFGSLGDEYWSKLSGLLTGGPIIAFFLWLTLAVTQQSANGANSGGSLARVLNLVRPDSGAGDANGATGVIGAVGSGLGSAGDAAVGATFGIITNIADSAHVASFVVGIAMMLTALDAAVKASGAVSGVLGNIAKKVGDRSKALGLRAALSPFAIGAAGAVAIDRRADLTGKASRLGLNTIGRMPFGKYIRPALQKGIVYRRKEAAQEAAEAQKGAMEIKQYGSLQEAMEYGKSFTAFTSPISTLGKRAASQKMSEVFGSNEVRDLIVKRTKDDKNIIDSVRKSANTLGVTMSESDVKAGAEIIAQKNARRNQAVEFQNQLAMARSRGDVDTVEKLEMTLKSNPGLKAEVDTLAVLDKIPGFSSLNPERSLKATQDEMIKQYDSLVTSPDKYKDVDDFTAGNGLLSARFMLKNGWESDKDGVLKKVDDAAWDRKRLEVKTANPKLAEALAAAEEYVKNSPGATVADLQNIQIRKNSADGNMQYYAIDDRGGSPGSSSGVRVRSKLQQDSINSLKTSFGAKTEPALYAKAVTNGVALNELLAKQIDTQKPLVEIDDFAEKLVGSEVAAASKILKDATVAEKEIKDSLASSKTYFEQVKFEQVKAKKAVDQSAAQGTVKPDLVQKFEEAQTRFTEAKTKYDNDKEKLKERINAIYAAATSDAIAAMSNTTKIFDQINDQGVSDTAQVTLIAQAQKNGLKQMYDNLDKLPNSDDGQIGKVLRAMAPVVSQRAENLRAKRSQGNELTPDESGVVAFSDDMRVTAASKPQGSAWRKMFEIK